MTLIHSGLSFNARPQTSQTASRQCNPSGSHLILSIDNAALFIPRGFRTRRVPRFAGVVGLILFQRHRPIVIPNIKGLHIEEMGIEVGPSFAAGEDAPAIAQSKVNGGLHPFGF